MPKLEHGLPILTLYTLPILCALDDRMFSFAVERKYFEDK